MKLQGPCNNNCICDCNLLLAKHGWTSRLKEGAHSVIHDALNIIHHVCDVKHDPDVLFEAPGDASRRVHVVARREGVRVRQRRKEHLDTDQELLQSCRYIIYVICGPLLRKLLSQRRTRAITSLPAAWSRLMPYPSMHGTGTLQANMGVQGFQSKRCNQKQGERLTPVLSTPLQDKIAIATPCQYVRKTTALTHKNLDTGRIGASSYFVP